MTRSSYPRPVPRYILAAYTPTASANATYAAPSDTVPYAFHTRFVGMDYDALMANIVRREAFKADVRAAVAKAAALTAANVEIANLTRGSVVGVEGCRPPCLERHAMAFCSPQPPTRVLADKPTAPLAVKPTAPHACLSPRPLLLKGGQHRSAHPQHLDRRPRQRLCQADV